MELRNKVNKRPIISLLIGLGFLSAILVATMIAASQNANNQNNNTSLNGSNNNSATTGMNGEILAVVKEIDTDHRWITLFNVNTMEEVVLSYNGGTDITDKYNKVISMSQIPLGIMVDADYQPDKKKLTSMNISTRAWEYDGVNNIGIDLTNQIMKIASTKYKYNSGLSVLDDGDFISVNALAEQDELTIWGNDETIWSVIITKGHGTVRLEDYGDYLGNNITIGYEAMQQISEGIEFTVREGEFNLTVENGQYSATKSVTVNRNQVTYVSLKDLGPIGPKVGAVAFNITPFGADLYIDSKLTSYTDPIDLEYGNHSITASLGGYTTYEGTITVDSEGKTIKIDLPEATSDEDATATETDTSSGSDNTDTTVSDGNPTTTPEDTGSEDVDENHRIYIQTPVGASVYLDGDFVGIAACSYKKVIGSHVLTFIMDGYETKSYTIEVSDDGLDAYFTYPELIKSN